MITYPEKQYFLAQKKLVIKAIEELQFEEILNPVFVTDHYELEINCKSKYEFQGKIGPWGNLQIDENSFTKLDESREVSNYTISDFFLEFQNHCGISDEILAQYIEEANQTIFSDLKVQSNLNEVNFSKLSFRSMDQILPGHPKLIMNKGRLGWSLNDIQKFAPEYRQSFQLHYVAIKNELIDKGLANNISSWDLVDSKITQSFPKHLNIKDYSLCPIHPWQWDKYIKTQYFYELASENMIDLGEQGDFFTAQSSIRTLSNCDKELSWDIKTSISILNTSCVRGIPSKYIEKGHHLSTFVEKVIDNDPHLRGRVDVLKETAAIKLKHDSFSKIKNASYRYKELLGCVWRECVQSKLVDNEIAIPTAALLLKNNQTTLLKTLINESNESTEKWLKDYFNVVVIPLYHLQVEHGLGLVAHGQNTILVLKNGKPVRLIIKDFHGDLRMADNSKHLSWEHQEVLDKLPSEYLIHDLITGHFVTVLRYLSRLVDEESLLVESMFYKILGESIREYALSQHKINHKNDLLQNEFEKILVNRVRFKVGYSETSTRLKPFLGRKIRNPIIQSLGAQL